MSFSMGVSCAFLIETGQIKRTELRPLYNEHQNVCALRIRGIVALFDFGNFAARLLDADRARPFAHVE